MRTALITGATDGIGKGLAIALAKRGWSIHVIGRNKEKGDRVIKELNTINMQAQHELFLLDLADIEKNKSFLQDYITTYKTLDLLFLNANIRPGKKPKIMPTGYDEVFTIGFFSRYLFTTKLTPLLKEKHNSRVIHNTFSSLALKPAIHTLYQPNYSGMKAMQHAYMADAYFTHYLSDHKASTVAHEVFTPGSVKTGQMMQLNLIQRFFISFLNVIEIDEIGEILAQHILENDAKDINGKFFERLKEKKVAKGFHHTEVTEKLIKLAEKVTGENIHIS